MNEWIQSLGSIGHKPGDTDEEKLRQQFLIYMGVLMSGGGILWGTIAASFGLILPAVVPYGYVVLTVLNLGLLKATKDFDRARWFQVFISLLLPFLFQWSLGGFVASGGVMLWAMLAIVGSLTFSSARQSLGWLGVYLGMTIASGIVDGSVRGSFSTNPSMDVSVAFFVTNITVISAIVFGLTIYLMVRREQALEALQAANDTISELNEGLEVEVAARTQEVRSALAERQAVLDNLVDGLVAVDDERVIRVVNPALTALFGLKEDPAGQRVVDGLPPALASVIENAASSGVTVHREIPLPGDRIGMVAASNITDEDGSHGGVALVRDITLEKEIDRMKTDFIATVSHELRTPLTSVLGFAKITKNKLEEKVLHHVPEDDKRAQRAVKQIRGNIDIIVGEGERLTTLINDVLDISKMEAGRMEWKMGPVDIAELVDRTTAAVASLFPAEGEVELRADVEPDLPTLQGDRDRLMQVLLNLVSNAAKFTEQGSVTVRARRVGSAVELAVIDTGEGIDPALHGSIFEKFKQVGDTLTNKPQGTGLGLPICKQIVRAHGGDVSVQSDLGAGATFAFSLPLTGDATSEVSRSRPSADLEHLVRTIEERVPTRAVAETGKDILVVDDDANLRELLRQELSERGYAVRLAANGYEAIGQVRARRPDLVILDVMMPELSGFDVAAMLKNDPTTESIPILILSIIQDEERGLRLGVDRYLTKPAESDTLIRAVQDLLGQVDSPRRVLVVDERSTTSSDIARLLETKGYQVVGTCTGQDAIDEARKTRPDLILVESMAEGHEQLLKTIRYEKDLEHIYVVQLMDAPEAEAKE